MAKKKKTQKELNDEAQAEVYQDEAPDDEAPVINERAPAGSGIKHDKHAPKSASENAND